MSTWEVPQAWAMSTWVLAPGFWLLASGSWLLAPGGWGEFLAALESCWRLRDLPVALESSGRLWRAARGSGELRSRQDSGFGRIL